MGSYVSGTSHVGSRVGVRRHIRSSSPTSRAVPGAHGAVCSAEGRDPLITSGCCAQGFVRGVAFSPGGDMLWTCGDDKTIKLWDREVEEEEGGLRAAVLPTATILGQYPFLGLDTHWSEDLVATCGVDVQVWDPQRSEPVTTLTWGSESVSSVRFNPIEHHVLASCASDRSVVLHDLRSSTAIRKLVLAKRSNRVAWNPLEAFNFVLANEDHNLYTFDMRKMDIAKCIHKVPPWSAAPRPGHHAAATRRRCPL